MPKRLGEELVTERLLWLIGLLVAAAISFVVARFVILPLIRKLVGKTKFTWDDVIFESNVVRRISLLAPALVGYFGVALIPDLDPDIELGVRNVSLGILIFGAMLALGATLDAINALYARRDSAKSRPIKGYVQIAKIFLYVIGSIVTLAVLMDKNPTVFLSGVGALTAVLMLVFKDTLLSFVASIQLASNDMLRVGDWLEMPQLGADGDVIDIALHTIKVQNWDKTISTIPTHRLINDSFKNWRGMSESGGRRIKRRINVDISSIRFLTEDEIDRLEGFALLKDYIADKKTDIAAYNKEHASGPNVVHKARRLTNIGCFRAYVAAYLREHPKIHRELTFLVRQLQSTPQGLPIEVYVFTNITGWNEYEDIQGDIFDHLLAIVDEFGLRLFQEPSGVDFRQAGLGEGSAGPHHRNTGL